MSTNIVRVEDIGMATRSISIKLTDLSVEKLVPRDKEFRVCDSVVSGLYLRVSPKGTKTWNWRGRVRGGKPGPGELKSVSLGRYPLYSLTDAREWARGMTLSRDIGNDMSAGRLSSLARSHEQSKKTCDWAFELYMENDGDALKSAAQKRRVYNHDIRPVLGERSIFDIEHDEIAALLQAKLATSPSGSNHIQAVLRRLFRWCVTGGRHLTGLTTDPSRDIEKLAYIKPRDRYLNDYEISLLLSVLNTLNRKWCEPVLMCLYTGMRRSEAFKLECLELVDPEKGILVIPGIRTKNGLDNVLVLPSELLVMLRARYSPLNRSKYVWPSIGKGDRPMSGFSQMTDALNEEMNKLAARDGRDVPHWSIHDLRRTVATGMNGLHDDDFHSLISSDVVERVINHKLPGMRAVYNRWAYMAEKKAALRIWADHLRSLWPEDMKLLQPPGCAIGSNAAVAIGRAAGTIPAEPSGGRGTDEILVGQSQAECSLRDNGWISLVTQD
jgi:integrase